MTADETHFNDIPFRPQRDPPADHSLLKPATVSGTDIVTATPIPPVAYAPAQAREAKVTAAPGSFSASIKAMMDEARAGVAKAREDGLAVVKDAVGKLDDAKVATAKVSAHMADTIKSEASDILAELGQISNDLGV